MKKRFIFYTFALLGLCLMYFAPNAHAQTVFDQAGLFTTEEIDALDKLAQPLDNTIKGKVFVATTTENQEDEETFADDFLRDQVGNNQNGSVFLIDMGNRGYHVSTSGNMIDFVTDTRLNDMLDTIQTQLAAGNYYQAATTYLTDLTKFVEAGIPNQQYQIDRDTGKITYYKSLTPLEITIALAVAAVFSIGFFVIIKSRYQLKGKTYRYPTEEKATLDLTEQQDRLTNSFVTTRRIPKPNNNNGGGFGGGSTTHSSGGGTFGGGGGKF